MKHYLSLVMILFFACISNAQSFNIEPYIKDTISSDNFFYHVKGVGEFSNSMVLKVELFDELDQSDVLFSGAYFFSESQAQNLQDFSYNLETKEFVFNIGNFPNTNMYLHMWIQEGTEIKNELFFK